MQVETLFQSINAKDWNHQSAWWATLLGRTWDREPMPSCREWGLRDGLLLQVLDNQGEGGAITVTLRIKNLDIELKRLEAAGIAFPAPEAVPGFKTLRYTRSKDPEGNQVGLLEGA